MQPISERREKTLKSNQDILVHAVLDEDLDLVLELIASGGNVDLTKAANLPAISPFFASLRSPNITILQHFLDMNVNVHARDSQGHTALHKAASHRNLLATKLLLDHGAEVSARDSDGCTPLHYSADYGAPNVLRFLLENEADLNALSSTNMSALDTAFYRKQNDATWTLIQAGAEISHPQHPIQGVRQTQTVEALNSNGIPQWLVPRPTGHVPHQLVSKLEARILRACQTTIKHHKSDFCDSCQILERANPREWKASFERTRLWRDSAKAFDSWILKRCAICMTLLHEHQAASLSKYEISYKRAFWGDQNAGFGSSRDNRQTESHLVVEIEEEVSVLLNGIESLDDKTTGSTCAFAIGAYWLRTCLTRHDSCSQYRTKIPLLPSRVLHVGSEDSIDDPFLYQTLRGQCGEYCCLSYRWDPTTAVTTTFRNIGDFTTSLPAGNLPKVIQDAITITRKLGIGYLWVDALCIVQDSPIDWQHEAKHMAEIYRNSTLTIVAVDAPKHPEGIFRPRKTQFLRPWNPQIPVEPSFRNWGHLHHPVKCRVSKDARARPRGEHDDRGWTLQEVLLSPRCLYYADGELFWQCISGMTSESHLTANSLLFVNPEDQGLLLSKSVIASVDDNIDGHLVYALLDQWKAIVGEYSRRKLTKTEDKLAALQGIISHFERGFQDKAVAAIWPKMIGETLSWTVVHDDKTPSSPQCFRAPSWSWLSTDRPVEYLGHGYPNTGRTMIKVNKMSSSGGIGSNGLTGEIMLQGHLKKLYRRREVDSDYLFSTPSPSESQHMKVNRGMEWDVSDAKGISGYDGRLNTAWVKWYPDIARIPKELRIVYCLLLTETNIQSCLCLSPTRRKENEYERIGVCSWNSKSSIFDDEFGSLGEDVELRMQGLTIV